MFTKQFNNDIIICVYEKGQGAMMEKFNGFPKEFVDFYIQLSFENTIAKQSENIVNYKKFIMEPLNQLYYELLPVACEINPSLETKPARCISTPYTDRRFSPATSLKEYMYLRFKQSGKNNDIVGLYFDMSADMYSYGLRIYKQSASGFQKIKDLALKKPKVFEKEIENIISNGYEIVGDKYKKDHYPQIKSDVLNDFLNRKTFYISKKVKLNDKVFTKELADEITEGFYQLKNFINLIIG
jgi:uncharacterized protein (DUF2461 family)